MKKISENKYRRLKKNLLSQAILLVATAELALRTLSSDFFSVQPMVDEKLFLFKDFYCNVAHFSKYGCNSPKFREKMCICLAENRDGYFIDVHKPGECKFYLLQSKRRKEIC